MKILIRVLLIIICCFLVACQPKEDNYLYLLSHPDFLEQEYKECRMDAKQKNDCTTVTRAAIDFVKYSNARRESPENFGKDIMLAENELAVANRALQLAKQNHQDISALNSAYEDKLEKVNALLAIVAATSVEG